MSVSRLLLILPLGLLISVSGCSGNRLRYVFASDREFMKLSELDEYNAKREADSDQVEVSDGMLASVSEDSSNESSEQEHVDVLSISRWLNPKLEHAVSPDPFLEDEPVEPVDENADSGSVMVVGHPNELSEELSSGDEDEQGKQRTRQDNADTVSFNEQERLPTFADILAEFEEDAEKPDDLDAQAEEWLANLNQDQSSSADEFEPLTGEAIEESDPADEFGDSTSFSAVAPSKEPSPVRDEGESQFDLVDIIDDSSETVSEDEGDVDDDFGNEYLHDSQNQPAGKDVIVDNEPLIEDSLWHPSGSISGWRDTESIIDKTKSELSFDEETGFPDVTRFNAEPVNPVSVSRLSSVTQSYDHTGSATDVITSVDVDNVPHGTPQLAMTAEFHSHLPDSDPFLSDFESQSVAGPAGSKTGIVAALSVRTWLMLLGGVVIAYLLIAPERQNLRNRNNR
ncbi:MAG: hypothetical protein MK110_01545 [Fuerstiella sp.]|nr:hypothetical protein [Fuerstiella sp.]